MNEPIYQHFIVSIQDHIANVSINRPEKANALNTTTWEELQSIFQTLSETNEVRVVILTGEGKLFCAGIDLELLMSVEDVVNNDCQGRQAEKLQSMIQQLQDSLNAVENCKKPVIAAIHNGCIGAGLDLIAACDLRYCSEDAYFSIKEIEMGLVADLGSLQRLPKFVSPSKIAEMAYTGQAIGAPEAKDSGLVNNFFRDRETLIEAVTKTALTIASKSPLSIRGTKEMLRYTRDHSVLEALQFVKLWNSTHLISDDLKESFEAFKEKRKPNYKD